MLDDRLPTVVVADDEPAVRDWLRVSLSLRGWVVSTASSGSEALELAASQMPDLVIVDYEMPGMTGMACAEELRRGGMADPIILFSAFIDAKRTEEAQRLDVQPMSKVDQPAFFRVIDALYERLVAPAAAGI
jgi:CheY-like chemotaxis protein